MEGSELFRHAEKWLTDNPGKTLRDYYKATGYTGPKLKPRQRAGEPIRISYKGKSSESQERRVLAETPKTETEAAYVRQTKSEARQISQDPIHQLTYGDRPSIAEHNVRLLSGGSNEYMSISDPDFKVYKDTVEQKVARMFPGGEYTVDIDDITGGVRVIDSRYHNTFEPTSQQKGFTLELGEDIDSALQSRLSKPGLSGTRGSIGFSRNLGRADAAAQTAANLATGNVAGAALSGGMLAAQEIAQSKTGQKAIAEILAKRAAKSGAKFVPGVDVAISAVEVIDYAKQGRFDQAGIAALSGLIGWVPVIGDASAAALDAGNTALDISRLDIPNNKPDIDGSGGTVRFKPRL